MTLEQRIRDKLGVSDAYLPDSVISQPDFMDVAEAIIDDIAPDGEGVWRDTALICQCAILLCPTMSARLPDVEKDSFYQRESKVDWEQRKKELEVERDTALSYLVDFAKTPGFTIT